MGKEHRSYLLRFTWLVPLMLGGFALAGYALGGLFRPESMRALLDHQEAKAEAARGVEVLFLGDSTLGNALDANEFSRLSGLKSLNLALTDEYGLAGAYNLMRRVQKNNHPRLIVLMHTPSTFVRSSSIRPYLLTLPGIPDLQILGAYELPKIAAGLKELFLPMRLGDFAQSSWNLLAGPPRHIERVFESLLHADYMPQGPVYRGGSGMRDVVEPLDPHAEAMLKKIRVASGGVPVVFVLPPLHRSLLGQYKQVLKAAEQLLEQIGIPMLRSSLILQDETIGDSLDHILPELRPQAVRDIYQTLVPFLARGT